MVVSCLPDIDDSNRICLRLSRLSSVLRSSMMNSVSEPANNSKNFSIYWYSFYFGSISTNVVNYVWSQLYCDMSYSICTININIPILIYLFIYLFIHSFIYLFIYSYIYLHHKIPFLLLLSYKIATLFYYHKILLLSFFG